MNGFWQDALKIVALSLGMVLFNCIFIILGSRFGWFLWAFKKVLAIRSRKQNEGQEPQSEEKEK